MITKDELWKIVREELRSLRSSERYKKINLDILEKLKETPQLEDNSKET